MNSFEIFNDQVLKVDYFYDFMQFLEYVLENGIKRTATGNISLNDINKLSKRFRQGKQLEFLDEEMGWKVRSEASCFYLNQIRVTAEVMYLLYKRKGWFLMSKNGKGFLSNLESFYQYEQMVLWFWNRVNWDYFSPSRGTTEILQDNQRSIWKALLECEKDWIDFKQFCQKIKAAFNLEHFYQGGFNPDFDLYLDIRYGLFERNLQRFGCVDVVLEKGEKEWQEELISFRSTDLGLHMYQKGLEPF